jgi:hypothetical protein
LLGRLVAGKGGEASGIYFYLSSLNPWLLGRLVAGKGGEASGIYFYLRILPPNEHCTVA